MDLGATIGGKREGLTYIEVIVAVSILAVAAIVTAASIHALVRAGDKADRLRQESRIVLSVTASMLLDENPEDLPFFEDSDWRIAKSEPYGGESDKSDPSWEGWTLSAEGRSAPPVRLDQPVPRAESDGR